jgi:hypothetical protein
MEALRMGIESQIVRGYDNTSFFVEETEGFGDEE